jgi:hypothetical protein
LSSAPSRVSVAVCPSIEAEPTAARAWAGLVAAIAATAAPSATSIIVGLM